MSNKSPEHQPALDFDKAEDTIRRVERNKQATKNYRPHDGKLKCDHCGGSMMEHRHGLSKQLGELICQLFRHTKRQVMVRELHQGYGKSSNFQKLRYFNLVDHDPKTATWWLTETGEQFARCTIRIQKHVWTYQAKVVKRPDGEDDREGPMLLITELVSGWDWKIDYAREARPHAA
jgi:hypothetical protein